MCRFFFLLVPWFGRDPAVLGRVDPPLPLYRPCPAWLLPCTLLAALRSESAPPWLSSPPSLPLPSLLPLPLLPPLLLLPLRRLLRARRSSASVRAAAAASELARCDLLAAWYLLRSCSYSSRSIWCVM